VNKLSWLFGFRSHKIWKMIVSVVYLIGCLYLSFVILRSSRNPMEAASNFILCFALLSPYFLLSNTPLRDSLPLFKQHKAGLSMVGMGAFFLILMLILSLFPVPDMPA